jgi:HSP20 family protein
MSLVRRGNMRDIRTMRDLMDRFMEDFYTPGFGLEEIGAPTLDMYQTEDDLVVKVALPGLKPEDIQISVTGDVLTLKGEFKEEQENKNANYHIRERRYGSFSRSIPLPVPVKSDNAKADFENGILTITLPKTEDIRPKTISVKANK